MKQREDSETIKWKTITALAVFGPLNASEVKRLLNPIRKTHSNEGIRRQDKTTNFPNNRTIDEALRTLNTTTPALAGLKHIPRKGIAYVEEDNIVYAKKDSSNRRYVLNLDNVLEKIISENSKVNLSNYTKESIITTLTKIWENNNYDSLASLRDRAWTRIYYNVRFDDLIFKIIKEILFLRIEAQILGGKERIGCSQLPYWDKIKDEELFYLAYLRNFKEKDRLFHTITFVLLPATNKQYSFIFDEKGEPVVKKTIDLIKDFQKKQAQQQVKTNRKGKEIKPSTIYEVVK